MLELGTRDDDCGIETTNVRRRVISFVDQTTFAFENENTKLFKLILKLRGDLAKDEPND